MFSPCQNEFCLKKIVTSPRLFSETDFISCCLGAKTFFLLMKLKHPLKMASKRLARMLVFTMALVCFLCLYAKLGTFEICIFCETKHEFFPFKRDGRFLRRPHMNCRQNPPFLVILVTSSHKQSKARMAIRETWGRERKIDNKRIVTYFLLGSTLTDVDQRAIDDENKKHRDIIQKDFLDSYYNLTLKTIMGLEWIHKFCPQTSFVMKTDSDMFVNTYYLIELLLKKNKKVSFFTGFLKENEHPIRKLISKWYVSEEEYSGNLYPPFCSGTGYVLSADVASSVYKIAKEVPYFKLEDVFVGMCLAKLDIKLEELHSEQTFFPEGLVFSACRFRKIVTSHFVRPHENLIYWDALERSLDENCHPGTYPGG
ncbi:beta-1,3-galactosyltransferase 5 isoform X2 [Podarcis raffonei]|uniref:beta-1,3-galactosyltransferase 5 isoform X2 n=1 Tax=Podarcis raffonei TaxID=65483 RepID=UPI002329637D|nr:beta-1,3-galactosyltransferase 5 isoform X2 [Podarcis raffonei]